MSGMALFRRAVLAIVIALPLASPGQAAAEGNCTTVDVDFLPAIQAANPFAPQIVAWIEDTSGVYVDTAFITAQTGTFGLGNRPGRFDFNSGPAWPYGRRITTFPVWAHRHGLEWDELVFRNREDSNLSHPFNQSSREDHYCRPLISTEPAWDAMTCASAVFTDKGAPDGTEKSLYPPRNDVAATTTDDAIVDMFDLLNPFDAVSAATPPAGTLATVSWPVPETLPFGDYVMFVEVSREFDTNASYNETNFPSPVGISFAEYGEAYRGQPSVVYRIPFSISATGATVATTTDYIGYGDPTGLDGVVRPPDATITTDVAGSGAGRLQLLSDGGNTFRIRVAAQPQFDSEPPALPARVQLVSEASTSVQIAFVAPGDDGTIGNVKKYDIRFRVGSDIDASNFDTSTMVTANVVPAPPGMIQTFTLDNLLPETSYSVGIRAIDDCHNASDVATLSFTTAERSVGDVEACFVATAAYGSLMAADVGMLRRFRDAMLRRSALGELAVEAYYTFGPAIAGVIGESDLLRATSRGALAPIVTRVRGLSFAEPSR